MVRKTVQWIPITALLLAVTWRPFVNYQIPLDLLVCAGTVLALFFIKHEIETHTDPTPRGKSL